MKTYPKTFTTTFHPNKVPAANNNTSRTVSNTCEYSLKKKDQEINSTDPAKKITIPKILRKPDKSYKSITLKKNEGQSKNAGLGIKTNNAEENKKQTGKDE